MLAPPCGIKTAPKEVCMPIGYGRISDTKHVLVLWPLHEKSHSAGHNRPAIGDFERKTVALLIVYNIQA
jgi:hypothetical protein